MQRRACAFGFATVLVFLPYAVVMTSAGCGDNKMPDALGDPPPKEAGVKKDTGPDVISVGDAGPCDLLPLGAYVTEVGMAGNAPAPTGGTIADGFYILTRAQLYGTGSSPTFAQSLVIQNGTMHFTKLIKGETTYENLIANYAVVTPPEGGTSTSIQLTFESCVDGGVSEAGSATQNFNYTATATEFTLSGTVSSGTIVDLFTKQ
jgi:hypothetical protein